MDPKTLRDYAHGEDCPDENRAFLLAAADAWEANLRGDMDEWLCETCNVVYMRKSLMGGPTNLVCPNGHGGCLPHETTKMLRLRKRLEAAEKRLAQFEEKDRLVHQIVTWTKSQHHPTQEEIDEWATRLAKQTSQLTD